MHFSLRCRLVGLLGTGIAVFASALPAQAEDGITYKAVKFGQVADMSGPAKSLGTALNTGIRAAFTQANKAGGIHQRQLILTSRDDKYVPKNALEHVKSLAVDEKVFAFIGLAGTPTSKRTIPYLQKKAIPTVGVLTGATFTREIRNDQVFNIRTSYMDEVARLIEHFVDKQGKKRVAVLYQDDAFGLEGLKGAVFAMAERKKELVARAPYTRGTEAVKTALIEIRRETPDVVLLIGTVGPVAKFIEVAHSIQFKPAFGSLSIIQSSAFFNRVGETGHGMVISNVVPDPAKADDPFIREYHAALKALDPKLKPEPISLEGYIAARITIEGLKRAGKNVDRARFLAALRAAPIKLGGMTITYGDKDNIGLETAFLRKIGPDGTLQPVR